MQINPAAGNSRADSLQIVTFEVGKTLLALDIATVQEINRSLRVTKVPHAPREVLGVTNLRGEVITILDLHVVLGIKTTEKTSASRNLIVNFDGELFGLGGRPRFGHYDHQYGAVATACELAGDIPQTTAWSSSSGRTFGDTP